MNLYEAFDVVVQQDSKTFPLSETASIDLLPMASDIARRKFDAMMEPYQPRIDAGGKLTEEENKRLNVRFFAEVVITGWQGLEDADGKPVPYSKENAKKLLEALPRFFALVVRMASNEEAFTSARAKADEGNSSAS
jgi:hypothetical protein